MRTAKATSGDVRFISHTENDVVKGGELVLQSITLNLYP
jgi:hypothetical protein